MTGDRLIDLDDLYPEAARVGAFSQGASREALWPDPGPLKFMDLPALHGVAPPPREWIVPELIPAKTVSIVSGHGATGKTTLMLQLCASMALGREWLTHMPTLGPSMVVCCEDDENEIHRRLLDIAAYHGCGFLDLGDVHPLSLAKMDAVMGAPDRSRIIRPTPLFERVRQSALVIRPKLIILDNAADIYAGHENERSMVRQFITLLRCLAIEVGAAIIITLHPSLTGISTGTGMSGSTAWFNSVRAQLYLYFPDAQDGRDVDQDVRFLELKKSNYGPIAGRVRLRWRDGVLVPEKELEVDCESSDREMEGLFLVLLQRLNTQNRTVSANRGANYAPSVFAREGTGASKGALERAMIRLLGAGRIINEPYGPPSRMRFRLVVA